MERILPQFQRDNPQLAVEAVVRRGRHPGLLAEYRKSALACASTLPLLPLSLLGAAQPAALDAARRPCVLAWPWQALGGPAKACPLRIAAGTGLRAARLLGAPAAVSAPLPQPPCWPRLTLSCLTSAPPRLCVVPQGTHQRGMLT